MEDKLISVNALAVAYCDIDAKYAEEPWLLSDILGVLNDAIAVDAAPVVHGRWIHSESMIRSSKCSVCEGWVTKHSVDDPDFKFCPYCGAKMDGERKNE